MLYESEIEDPNPRDHVRCLSDLPNGESILDAFKQKEELVKNLPIEDLIRNYLDDKNLIELIRKYVGENANPPKKMKSEQESIRLRNEGNERYKARNFTQALENYNDGVLMAPAGSCLALCYSNRSATLFEMAEYSKCQKDIDRALSISECPDHLKFKLNVRKTRCLLRMNFLQAAKESLDELMRTSNGCHLKEIKELENEISAYKMGPVKENLDELRLFCGENPDISPLSSAVSIRHCPEKGRYAIANRPIQVGDVLIKERPYVCALVPDIYQVDHCWNCTAKTLLSTVPCFHCSQIRYCSEECRDEAWQKHHNYECGFHHFLIFLSQSFLPLRIMFAAGVEKVLAAKEEIDRRRHSVLPGFEETGKFEHEDYYCIYHMPIFCDLEANADMKHDAINGAIFSLAFLELLYESRRKFEDKEREYLAQILVRHFLQVKCNSCYIDEYFRVASETSPMDLMMSQPLGGGVYPVSSLLNHSCDPNVSVTSLASLNVFVAIRSAKEGDELCISYGPNRFEKTKNERQKHLRQNFCFDCRCVACEEDGPDLSLVELYQDFETFLPKITSSPDLVQVAYMFSKASINLVTERLAVAVVLFSTCLRMLEGRPLRKMMLEVHDQLYVCLDRLIAVVNDDTTGEDRTTCGFDGTKIPEASNRNLDLMLDAIGLGLDSLPIIDPSGGLESDIVSGLAMRYVRVLIRMAHERLALVRHTNWHELAVRGRELMTTIQENRNLHFAAGDGYLDYIDDVFSSLSKCL